MQNLQLVMIGVAFALGVSLCIVAAVALFRGARGAAGAEGSFEAFKIKFAGKGAPAMFLLSGLVLVLSGSGWAMTREEVKVQETKVQEQAEVVRKVTQEAVTLHTDLQNQVRFNQVLTQRVPASALLELKQRDPSIFEKPNLELSPLLKQKLAVMPHR